MARTRKIIENPAPQAENAEISVENDPEIQVSAVDDADSAQKEPDDALAQLKKSLEEERQARQAEAQRRLEAERRANDAERAAHAARAEVDTTNQQLVESVSEQLQREGAILERNLADAYSRGDFATVAKVQRAIARNEAKLETLEVGANAYKEKKPEAPPAPRYSDVADAFAAQLQGASRDWVLRNRDTIRSQADVNAVIGAHNIAVKKGLRADTPEYFEAVERILDINPNRALMRSRVEAGVGEDDDGLSEAASARSARSSPPAIPVSRSGAGPGASGSRTIRLTPEEIEIAKQSDLTPEEYYRNKMAIQKELRH